MQIPGVRGEPSDVSEMIAAIERWESHGDLISDDVAKAIARLYHSPNSPSVTALSHGLGFAAAELEAQIASDADARPVDDNDIFGRPALGALRAWLDQRRSSER